MELWIAGRSWFFEDGTAGKQSWEMMGIYDTKDAARGRCRRCDDEVRDWIAPATLNEDMPEETVEWEDAEFYMYHFGMEDGE